LSHQTRNESESKLTNPLPLMTQHNYEESPSEVVLHQQH